MTHALYGALYQLIASAPQRVSPQPTPAQARVLGRAWQELPSRGANDGIVPTLSGAFGRVIHAAEGDPLDVLGHFRDATQTPPHVDWLASGSGFDRRRFDALREDVAQLLATEAPSPRKRRRAGAPPEAGRKRIRSQGRRR